jgi:hypothetical protein
LNSISYFLAQAKDLLPFLGSKQGGFASPSAFIRHAVEQELSGREDHFIGAEERLAASIEQVRHDLFRLMRAQQALFAYVDTLAKTLLTCVPEPPADTKPQAVARAKERYDRLLTRISQAGCSKKPSFLA